MRCSSPPPAAHAAAGHAAREGPRASSTRRTASPPTISSPRRRQGGRHADGRRPDAGRRRPASREPDQGRRAGLHQGLRSEVWAGSTSTFGANTFDAGLLLLGKGDPRGAEEGEAGHARVPRHCVTRWRRRRKWSAHRVFNMSAEPQRRWMPGRGMMTVKGGRVDAGAKAAPWSSCAGKTRVPTPRKEVPSPSRFSRSEVLPSRAAG